MLFEKRINIRPYEYPELLDYANAMRHSYWIHTEYNYTGDVQDYHTMSQEERTIFRRTMLAIAHVEVSVKSFWWDLYKSLPKPEIATVGTVFGESETRHEELYSHVLELLGLQEEFLTLLDVPAIQKRIATIDKAMKDKGVSQKEFVKSLIFFSLFTENVSLFSQFYIAMSYNKFKGYMKGMSNGIEASTKEEDLHADFGAAVINIIRQEYPELITSQDEQEIIDLCSQALENEGEIVDWIFSEGDIEYIHKDVVKNYIAYRMNKGLKAIGIEHTFPVDETLVLQTNWFEDEILVTKHTDFFNKRSTNYTKRSKSFSSDDLF